MIEPGVDENQLRAVTQLHPDLKTDVLFAVRRRCAEVQRRCAKLQRQTDMPWDYQCELCETVYSEHQVQPRAYCLGCDSEEEMCPVQAPASLTESGDGNG